VGGVARFRLQRERHHVLDGGIRDAARGPWARFIQQPIEPRGQKPTAPLADGLLRQPQLARDLRIRAAARPRQDKSRSLRQCLCRRRPTGPAFQRVAFPVGQRQHRNGATDGNERSPFSRENAQCVHVVPSFSDSRD